jgi:hypothetical protein
MTIKQPSNRLNMSSSSLFHMPMHFAAGLKLDQMRRMLLIACLADTAQATMWTPALQEGQDNDLRQCNAVL